MLRSLKQLFTELVALPAQPIDPHELEVISAALLVQLAGIDQQVDSSELETIRQHLSAVFKLDAAQIEEVMALAHTRADASTSLYEFTSVLNQGCTPEQKIQVVRELWKVAYADGQLDRYEEHFVRRAAELLYVPHQDFIRTKLEIQPQ